MMEAQEVIGYACGDIQVIVECPHCHSLHFHGRETPGNVSIGHRVADCYGDNGGYVISTVLPLAELVAKTKTRISVMNRNARLMREVMECAAGA